MKCLHGPCTCEVDPRERFCGEQCENADQALSPECPCGHPQCHAETPDRVRRD